MTRAQIINTMEAEGYYFRDEENKKWMEAMFDENTLMNFLENYRKNKRD